MTCGCKNPAGCDDRSEGCQLKAKWMPPMFIGIDKGAPTQYLSPGTHARTAEDYVDIQVKRLDGPIEGTHADMVITDDIEPDWGRFFPSLRNPTHRKGYVVGALANPAIPDYAAKLRRELGWEIFDDWHAAHPEADDQWRHYEVTRGRTYEQALRAYAGQNVFQFDKGHLNSSTHGLLVLPAGRSGHMEIAYLAGQGKTTAILLDEDYDRWDVMYAFVDLVTKDIDEVIERWRQ